jgi:4-aminobutyrate aminotransferase-like enzyme
VGGQIARLDRALAGFFHPALGQPIVWDVRRVPALLSMLPQVESSAARTLVGAAAERIEGLLPRLRGLRSQAIHGDCHGRNLIANEDRNACVGIIDLGDMIHAPLVLEIAVTMAEFLVDDLASMDGVSELLAGYEAVQPLEQADHEVLYDLMAARIAAEVLIQTWRARNGVDVAARGVEEKCGRALETLAVRGARHREAQARAAQRHEVEGRGIEALGPQVRGPVVGRTSGRQSEADASILARRHAALGANAELSYDRPLHLVRGEGVWLYAADGERVLDVYNNVPHVGHAHPVVVEAIARQTGRIASNTRYLDERIIEYVERLKATLPEELDTCLFVNSGSEANDVAWRMAKAHTGQAGALVMKFAYHGITEAITALSPAIATTAAAHVEQLAAPIGGAAPGDPTSAGGGRGAGAAGGAAAESNHRRATGAEGASEAVTVVGTAAARLGAPGGPNARTAAGDAVAEAAGADVRAALERLKSRGLGLAALMIDSGITSTGIYDPPPSWIAPIEAAVRAAGGLIIGDEVQFGLGRSGSDFWGFNRRGYHPDIVTLGKPVGNGYPLGVVITRRAILEKFQRDTGFFSTFGGNPVAATAGIAVLDVLAKENLMENARTTGEYFINKLRALTPNFEAIKEVRGRGLMVGIEVTDRALTKQLVNALRNRGVLIGSEGPQGNVLKLRPPMPFQPEHADIVVDALTAVLSAVRS